MIVNQKPKGRAVSIPIGLAAGVGVSMTITILMAAASAYMEEKELLGENGIGYCLMVTLVLASVVGAITAAGKIKRMRIPVCIGLGTCYFVTLIAVTALFFGGQYSGVGTTGLLILGGSAAAGLIGSNKKRSTSVRVKKIKNR